MRARRDWRHASAGIALGAVLFWAMPALPQTGGHQPDAKRGAIITEQGTPAGAVPCARCHGQTGMGDDSGTFPRIAAQSTRYLTAQLRDFAADLRPEDIMTPIAKAMTPDEMADVAAYLCGDRRRRFRRCPPPTRNLSCAASSSRPSAMRRRPCRPATAVPRPGGTGEPPTVPYLAGQFSRYIGQTLQAWQQGLRKNGTNVMGPIGKQLTDDDIAAVAAYRSAVRPPSTAATK